MSHIDTVHEDAGSPCFVLVVLCVLEQVLQMRSLSLAEQRPQEKDGIERVEHGRAEQSLQEKDRIDAW